jgi:hypothetical protein
MNLDICQYISAAPDKNEVYDIQNRHNSEYTAIVRMCFGYFLHTQNFADFESHIFGFGLGT